MASPGVGASWARSSGSSFSLVKSSPAPSSAAASLPALKKLCMPSVGLKSASVWSMEKITDSSSTALRKDSTRAHNRPLPPSSAFQSLEIPEVPQDVVDAHDALGLGVAAVVDDGALSLHPHVAAVLGQHSVVPADRLALGAHCRKERKGRRKRYTPGVERINRPKD